MTFLNWALRRQIFYVSIFVLFILVVGFLIISPNFNKAPACNDGRQNGDETGVDCGGSCIKACIVQTDDMSVLWSRAFKVIPGRYNAVAYVVNHNKNNAVKKINYRFRFADKNNVYIGKRDGSTFVPAGGNFAVFEPAIDVGNSIPVYVSFEFTEMPVWLQVKADLLNQLKLDVSNISLSGETTSPLLSANIKNNSLFTIPNVGVVSILYDKNGNAISASRTYLEQLPPLQNADVNFTWPEPFPGTVVTKEIIPMFDIFSVKQE